MRAHSLPAIFQPKHHTPICVDFMRVFPTLGLIVQRRRANDICRNRIAIFLDRLTVDISWEFHFTALLVAKISGNLEVLDNR